MTIKFGSTVLAATLLLALSATGGMAAAAQGERDSTKLAEAPQARPAPGVDDEDSANCSRSRKRLWVESEGWIVRRVTICR